MYCEQTSGELSGLCSDRSFFLWWVWFTGDFSNYSDYVSFLTHLNFHTEKCKECLTL